MVYMWMTKAAIWKASCSHCDSLPKTAQEAFSPSFCRLLQELISEENGNFMHSLDCEQVEEKKETQIVFSSKCLFIFKCILLLFSCFSTFRAMLKRVKTMVRGTCRKTVST